MTVQVYPTIDLGDYQAVRAEPRPVAITDEQVEETLGRLQTHHSPWHELTEERAAQDGDRVTVDVTVSEVDSDEPAREPLLDSVYVLGQDNLFEELHDALVGMNVGDEHDVEIIFADDNEAVDATMRGKSMNYHLALKKIEAQDKLPLDDEFAKTATEGRQETLEALRADIHKDLLRGEHQKARNEVSTEVIAAMSEQANLELPTVMIEKQLDSDVENMRNHLGQEHNQTLESHLRTLDKTEAELREEMRPEAIRRLRNSLVLREIASQEGISVNAQDIDAEIDQLAGRMGDNPQMRQFYSSNYVRNMLENDLFERKLIDRLIDIATEGRGPADPPAEPEQPTLQEEAPAETPALEVAAEPVNHEETPEEVAEALEVGDSLPMDEAETSAAEEHTEDTTTSNAPEQGEHQ